MLINSTATMVVAFFGTIASVSWSVANVWGKRIDAHRDTAASGTDLGTRLDGIERAIDAVALEVERLGESQRFANRQREARAGALADGYRADPH